MSVKWLIVGCLVALLVGVGLGSYSETVVLTSEEPPQELTKAGTPKQAALDAFCAEFAKATGMALDMVECTAE
jgi:hypothetical protein